MRVGVAQIAPRFLDRAAGVEKVAEHVGRAAEAGCSLVAFGETMVPAYPLWLCRTGGARFDDPEQKALHALYLDQGVQIERGDLEPVQEAARRGGIHVVLGVAERPLDRGGHTLYCSAVVIAPSGQIAHVHRKLMPTHEERLCWGIGDGVGLIAHQVGAFRLGVLNCWESWMPLARAALHAQGVDLLVLLWPGSARLTRDITRFAALEGRSYVVSASGLVRESDIPPGTPLRDRMASAGEMVYDGGSCIADPAGQWLVEPAIGAESLLTAELDPVRIREERQNFDISGHYARPDVLRLEVTRAGSRGRLPGPPTVD